MARELDATFYEPIAVVLPRADQPLTFAAAIGRGSAFVIAGPPQHDRQVVYYEEPREGLEYNFADRVLHAHGRAWQDSPKGQQRRWPSPHRLIAARVSEIVQIGNYNPREGEITLEDDPALREQLLAWLGLSDAPDPAAALAAELETSSSAGHDSRRAIRRALAAGRRNDPVLRGFARRMGHGDLLGDPPEQP